MRVMVSRDRCIASGMCALACAQVFTQSDVDGTVEVLDRQPVVSLLEKVKQAVRDCPAQVFQIEDEDDVREIRIEDV